VSLDLFILKCLEILAKYPFGGGTPPCPYIKTDPPFSMLFSGYYYIFSAAMLGSYSIEDLGLE
jgi:hypothetical protein